MHAQYPYDSKRDNLWFFGYNDGNQFSPMAGVTQLSFDNNQLNINYRDTFSDFLSTNAIACDQNGNFLFCTNGVWLYNKEFDKMQGCDTFVGFPVIRPAIS